MKTALFEAHQKLDAKIIDFAGFQMPVNYPDGIVEECKAVRSSVGMFDVSHMGQFIVSGPGALSFLQKMTSNDVSALEVFDAQYNAMCYNDGGVVDDLILYRRENDYFLVVNAANIEKDFEWLEKHCPKNVALSNGSANWSLIAIQGPKVRELLEKFTSADLFIKFYSFSNAKIADRDVMLSRTGYTGELGFEIYCNHDSARELWRLFSEDELVKPVGLAARDVLRMEMKYALYGNDITKDTNLIEAGLSWITDLKKGEFIGRETCVKTKEEKPSRRLVCFELEGRGIPRQDYKIYSGEKEVGIVTSGTQSPSLNKGIGLAYVKKGFGKIGKALELEIRNKRIPIRIARPPFVKDTSLMS